MVKGRIEKVRDYGRPVLLRKANISYQNALAQFKKGKWQEAKDQYERYIKNDNKIDFDAYYEVALCYSYLWVKEQEKQKSKKSVEAKQSKKEIDVLYVEAKRNFEKAKHYDSKNKLLPDIVLRRKDKRKIIIGILEVKEKLNHDSKFLQMMGRIKRRTN